MTSQLAAFGDIRLALAGERSTHPGGGKVKGYEWWQARGFDATFELLNTDGRATSAKGELVFLLHRRSRPLMRARSFAPDRSGIDAARTAAARTGVEPGADDLFYEFAVPADEGSEAPPRGPLTYYEERPVLWWPVGVQTLATFRISAWFVPAEGSITFAERDVDLFWADAAPPVEGAVART